MAQTIFYFHSSDFALWLLCLSGCLLVLISNFYSLLNAICGAFILHFPFHVFILLHFGAAESEFLLFRSSLSFVLFHSCTFTFRHSTFHPFCSYKTKTLSIFSHHIATHHFDALLHVHLDIYFRCKSQSIALHKKCA